MIAVSIVIVNYNTATLTEGAILSICQYTTDIDYEIIVVDNASSDTISAIASSYPNKVRLVLLPENIGFGRANNEGLKVAKGRNILFLNPDTLLLNNAVKILSDFLDQHPTVGVCGANLYAEDGTPIHSYMPSLPSPMWEFNSLVGNLIFAVLYGKNEQFNHTELPLKVGYITGADMMVRRDVLEQCGAFDADFFMYYEETELTYRIEKAGFISMSIPSAHIVHLEGQSIDTNQRRELLKSISRRLYYAKTQSKIALFTANVLLSLNCWLRIGVYSVLMKPKETTYWKLIYKNI
ncbi:MAG: glycosyltransferase family 2 protein [Paludibacteraceae bacterium]|nr:glycosyltransferase family 2 protein [Paludibacteraceae bacterium]